MASRKSDLTFPANRRKLLASQQEDEDMRLTVTIDLDMDAYRAKYGPGTEWWAKYRTTQVKVTSEDGNITWQAVQESPEAYEFNKNPKPVEEMVRDILEEGFYDWAKEGWLKVDVG